MLVDEHPVGAGLIGLDMPYVFGGRAGAEVQSMVEQIFAANPALEAAIEAGVDLALGVRCWGVFYPTTPCASCRAPSPVLATGGRDFVVFFDGADQPGVIGATAFHSLVTR